MKKRVPYLFIFLAFAALTACNNNGYKKTKSGLLYKIISDGKGDVAKRGQFLKFNIEQKVHDSLLFSTDTMPLPGYARVDSVGPTYRLAEIFPMLRKGDSAVVVQLVDSIEKKYHQPIPPFIHRTDKLITTLRVLEVFTSDSLLDKDRTKLLDIEKQKEIATIQDYLKKNNINGVQQTAKGNFYLITEHGNGPKADSSKKISISYNGSSLDGKYFDSNIDSTKQVQKHPLEPFSFVPERGGAVPGMLDVATEFHQGDKGKIFLPGVMGYGQQGAGTVIKPFENLIFDIEIDSVTVAPPPQMRGMQGMPGSRLQMNSKGQIQLPAKKNK